MEAVVVAEDVRKTYGDTTALEGVSLSVERGEVFALIGPNGAGKTTLVRALTGTTVPDDGTTALLGASPRAVDRDRLGVLPQDFSPPDRLTARELLAYYAGLYESARDPETVLEEVGLAGSGETWYENLSGGQQRRVCVGTALVNDPDVCVLDEPTTGIDPAGRRTVWHLIESLADAGTTVVLTTHDMAEARRLGDRVGLLADGALVAVGTPDDLIAEYAGSSRLLVETDVGATDDAAAGEGEGTEIAGASGDAGDHDVEGDPRETGRTRGAGDARDAPFEDLGFPIERGRRDGTIVVRDVLPAEIGTVVTFLEDRGIEYSGLEWTEPDLEDVYLALADDVERTRTGRIDAEAVVDSDSDSESKAESASESETASPGGER